MTFDLILEVNNVIYDNSLNNFLKSILFSPDGTLILSVSETDHNFMIWDSTSVSAEVNSSEHANSSFECNQKNRNINLFSKFSAGESIYDSKWYPFADVNDPTSCCFISTTRDHPIQLWDVSGFLRCTYVGHNQQDELDSANSLSFNLTGERIYAGSNSTIRLVQCSRCRLPRC